jgi:hypothetical protein
MVMGTETLVRETDPDTSHLAAFKIAAKTDGIRKRVHYLFRSYGPMTDYTLELLYAHVFEPRPYSSVRKRRTELRDAGIIRDSGRRETIPTGSSAIVWELVP